MRPMYDTERSSVRSCPGRDVSRRSASRQSGEVTSGSFLRVRDLARVTVRQSTAVPEAGRRRLNGHVRSVTVDRLRHLLAIRGNSCQTNGRAG